MKKDSIFATRLSGKKLQQRNSLVEKNIDLVRYWGRRYYMRSDLPSLMDRDDAKQEAAIATIIAVTVHRPERGANLESYIYSRCLWHYSSVRDPLRNWRIPAQSLYEKLTGPFSKDNPPIDEVMRRERADLLQQAIKELPKRHAYVLNNLYGVGLEKPMHVNRIAKHFRCCTGNIYRIAEEARQKLAKVLKQEDFYE